MVLWYSKISSNNTLTKCIYNKKYVVNDNVYLFKKSIDDEYYLCNFESCSLFSKSGDIIYKINPGLSFTIKNIYNCYNCMGDVYTKCYAELDNSLDVKNISSILVKNKFCKILETSIISDVPNITCIIINLHDFFSYTDNDQENVYYIDISRNIKLNTPNIVLLNKNE